MAAPQIIVLGLFALNVAAALIQVGKDSNGGNFVASLLSTALMVGLLYWGGFWTT